MVCIKTRYIVVGIETEATSIEPLETTLIPVIRNRITEDYGVFTSSLGGRLSIVEFLPKIKIAIIKCDVEICKYVVFTLVTNEYVSGIRCSFSVLWISGILKKAMKKVLMLNNKEVETGVKN